MTAIAKPYRLDLNYLGTRYQGWQSQVDGSGVQDEVTKALQVFLRHPVKVIGSSRTDAGVHAEEQVATFESAAEIDPYRFMRGLNSILPVDIGVISVTPAPPGFHPILSAQGKAYRFRLWRSLTKNPFIADYVWSVPATINLDVIKKEAASFVGFHDFSSFCASDSSAKTKERDVWSCEIVERGPLIDIWVTGAGFLKQMIRAMVGTLVEFGLGKRPQESVREMLALRDRTKAGATAPAKGLCLVKIFYDKPPLLHDLIRSSERGFSQALSVI